MVATSKTGNGTTWPQVIGLMPPLVQLYTLMGAPLACLAVCQATQTSKLMQMSTGTMSAMQSRLTVTVMVTITMVTIIVNTNLQWRVLMIPFPAAAIIPLGPSEFR